MIVLSLLAIELSIPGSDSLKDKRQVVRSLLDSIRSKYNVSAAEIDHLDNHRSAGLAFACVSNDKALANRMLDKILSQVASNPLCEVVASDLQFL